jgi:hypothetical protein
MGSILEVCFHFLADIWAAEKGELQKVGLLENNALLL